MRMAALGGSQERTFAHPRSMVTLSAELMLVRDAVKDGFEPF